MNSAGPASQFISLPDVNVGFGLLYYALARLCAPRKMLVIGSRRIFPLLCFALAMKDGGGQGRLLFVDTGAPEADGWTDGEPAPVLTQLASFGAASLVKRYAMTSGAFFELYERHEVADFDAAFIDASHTREGFRHDFERTAGLVSKGGLIIFPDAAVSEENSPLLGRYSGVAKAVDEFVRGNPKFELLTLPVFPGLGMARRV